MKLYRKWNKKQKTTNPTNPKKIELLFVVNLNLVHPLIMKLVFILQSFPWVPAVQRKPQPEGFVACEASCQWSATKTRRFLGWSKSGQIIATSHDLTPKGSWEREIPLFQGNLGSSLFGEDDSQFDDHIFQRGWFNHQLEMGVAGVPLNVR